MEKWDRILQLPVTKNRSFDKVYVRFGPVLATKRGYHSAMELMSFHEAMASSPNDANQDRYFVEFLEAVTATKGKLRDEDLHQP